MDWLSSFILYQEVFACQSITVAPTLISVIGNLFVIIIILILPQQLCSWLVTNWELGTTLWVQLGYETAEGSQLAAGSCWFSPFDSVAELQLLLIRWEHFSLNITHTHSHTHYRPMLTKKLDCVVKISVPVRASFHLINWPLWLMMMLLLSLLLLLLKCIEVGDAAVHFQLLLFQCSLSLIWSATSRAASPTLRKFVSLSFFLYSNLTLH